MAISRRGLFGSLIGAAALTSPIAAMATTSGSVPGVVTDYDKIEAWMDDDDLTRDTPRFRMKLYQELRRREMAQSEAVELVTTWFMSTEVLRRKGVVTLYFSIKFLRSWAEANYRVECEAACRKLGYFARLDFRFDQQLFAKKRGLALSRHREQTLQMIRELEV